MMDLANNYFLNEDVLLGDDLMLDHDPAMDPYPFYPILDGASDMCVGKSDGCEVCGVGKKHGEEPSFPSQLPLLDWSDVESQLGEVADEDSMRCVDINQIISLSIKPDPDSESNHMDKVISDCMWSSSSAHRMDMDSPDPLPKLFVDNDFEFSRPDTPQTDTESLGTDCDDLFQRVPKEKNVRKVVSPVTVKPQVSNGRSLLKRNQFLKVARAPLRTEQKPSLPSSLTDSFAGDHSYSATTCIGILTPSPSPSESSSDDDNGDARSQWRIQARQRQRAPVDSHAVSERLLSRPLKARKHNRTGHGQHKYRSDRCRMPSDDDQPLPERRNNHNNMERLRRDLLRGALNSLRRLVPDTASNDKAPKITVLREAAKYCMMLKGKDEALTKQKRRMEEQRAALRRRLEMLQRAR